MPSEMKIRILLQVLACNATHHRKQNERNPFLANGPGQFIHGFDEPFRGHSNQLGENGWAEEG
jgi:hypothetical protein